MPVHSLARRSLTTALAIAGLLAAVPPALGQLTVLVVDPAGGPGSDFTDLQTAVDAAQDGDVLLLRDGFHGGGVFFPTPVVVDAKGLVLVEEDGATAHVGNMIVRNTAPGQPVTLRGLSYGDGNSVQVLDCQDVVWIEDCDFTLNINGSPAAVRAQNSAAVHLNRCAAECFQFVATPGAQLARVTAVDTDLHLYDCTIQGCDANPYAPTAMSGVSVEGGSLFVSGSELLGGDGCGGSGLLLLDGDPVAQVLDSTVLAGACATGTPDVDVHTGTVVPLPNAARSFSVTSTVPGGGVVSLSFRGEPGDFVFLDLGLAPARVEWPFTTGVWQLSPSAYLATYFFGQLPASGEKTVDVTLPATGAAGHAYLQADYFDAAGLGLTLSGGSYLLLLP